MSEEHLTPFQRYKIEMDKIIEEKIQNIRDSIEQVEKLSKYLSEALNRIEQLENPNINIENSDISVSQFHDGFHQ